MKTHVFCYGSNMLTDRIRARVANAAPVTTGYVTCRKFSFHKRSRDGSAKADARQTGWDGDHIWGVVFSLTRDDKMILDDFEHGYDEEQVIVAGSRGKIAASIYVAHPEWIDQSLKPYCWYHRYVIEGAIEHRLPASYIQNLQSHAFVADHDHARVKLNSRTTSS